MSDKYLTFRGQTVDLIEATSKRLGLPHTRVIREVLGRFLSELEKHLPVAPDGEPAMTLEEASKITSLPMTRLVDLLINRYLGKLVEELRKVETNE